jgi:hypothetical protein
MFMNDPEFALRRFAISELENCCECQELAPIEFKGGGAGEVDVVCRPKEQALARFAFAVEIKAHIQIGDGQLGPWLKQASDYVGARPLNGWPVIAAAFVWFGDIPLHPDPEERQRMAGMLQLAQHYRVGRAHQTLAGLTLVFGPSAEIYRAGNWTKRAEPLLAAKRVQGGQRKPMAPAAKRQDATAAAKEILERARGPSLGGLSIRDLIDEGRR